MKVHKLSYMDGIEYWYDRSTRCWWAAKFDTEGNQVGEALDAYSLDDLLVCIDINFRD